MSRTTRTIAGVIVVIVILGLAGLAYIWFSGGSGAPSATLSAPTLAISTRPPTTPPTQIPTTAATAEATAATVEPFAAATGEATTEATAEATTAAAADTGMVVFNISTSGSKVSFTLGEVLNGSPNTVVGSTDQVAGQIGVDFSSPANSQIGEIRIDARTLATDSSMRDRMIRGQILQSSQDKYEFVSFKPTALTGLPSSVTMGTAFSFQVAGDLTIRNITKPVTFDVTVTPDSTSKIEGKATATVKRDDFGLTIPNVPSVTSADQDVKLEIDFVANSSEPAAAVVTAEATVVPISEATAEVTSVPTSEASAEATSAASSATSNLSVFNIATDQSQVSFTLNEVLRGTKNQVVGKTNQVAGQIGVDFSAPQNSQIGEILIDARTLATDDPMRDRTTRGQILQSAQDKYEFISFKPTALTGLPTSTAMGTAFTFQVTGDLTIRDITKPATFDVTVTPDSQTQIEGKATATVLRSDFGLTIPNLPMVANVDDAVKLEIDFVATAAN